MGTLGIGNAFCTGPGPNWRREQTCLATVMNSTVYNQHVLQRTTMSETIKLVTGRGT